MATQRSKQSESTPHRNKGRPDQFKRTDAGNAELFAAIYRDHLRFDHSRQRWLLYDTHYWRSDVDGSLMRLAKQAVRLRLHHSSGISDDEKRREEAKWALKSEFLARLEAMVQLAKSEKPIADDGSKWDGNSWLMAVTNGVIDLRTGNLRAGAPEDLITLHAEIAFDPDAQCPRWMRFLDEVFDGDAELISYVWRAVGYSLTGDTSEQCLFCCCGDGANGKSTFLNTIRHALGTYSGNLPFSAFELTARSAISNDVATLPGKRFVTAIETDESARLNEARIKALTGGDILTARQLYRDFFNFKPVAKFWLAFNHQPIVADDSHGFWRRPHLIPFDKQFDLRTDPELEDTLQGEAPGILAWAVRGCLAWQSQGLNTPAVVIAATQAFRTESDPLQDFLDDRCEFGPGAQVSAAALIEEYASWARQTGERKTFTRTQLTRRLEAMGLQKRRHGHTRAWTWFRIRLKGGIEWPVSAGEPPAPAPAACADMRTCADVKL
jgi:putative DNA primase/helicase